MNRPNIIAPIIAVTLVAHDVAISVAATAAATGAQTVPVTAAPAPAPTVPGAPAPAPAAPAPAAPAPAAPAPAAPAEPTPAAPSVPTPSVPPPAAPAEPTPSAPAPATPSVPAPSAESPPVSGPAAASRPATSPAATARYIKHEVRGKIVDAESKQPVPGAVLTATSGDTAISDADGSFVLAVTDDDTLIVEADGYERTRVSAALPEDAQITLAPAKVSGEEVVEVRGRAPAVVSGGVTLNRRELATIPGTGGDLLASLTVLPGVSLPVGNQNGNGVIIRGSAPQDSRFLIDGYDIPQLYHLFNRSIIPTQAIADLQFQPGGFDVKYGRASSGIIAVTTRGGNDKLEAVSEVSLIDAYVVASGPINKKLRMLGSFRRSYVDTWLPSVLPDRIGIVAAPRFYDGLVRLDWDPTTRWHGAMTVVGSSDLTKLIATQDQRAEDINFSAETGFVRAIAAAYWRGPRKLTVDVSASALTQLVSFSAGPTFLDIWQLSFATRSEVTKRFDEWAGLRNVTMRAGFEYDPRRYRLRIDARQQTETPNQQQDINDTSGARNKFDGTFWTNNVAGWAVLEGSLAPQVTFQSGVRVDGFLRNDTFAVQPRGELVWKPTGKDKIRLSAGRYTRPPENRDEILNANLGPESAAQVALGGEHKIDDGSSLQLTLYNTERTQLIRRDEANVYQNQGRGQSYGAEVLAQYRTNQMFFWLAYSLSRSTRRATAASPDILFDYDQTHAVVLATTYRTKNQKWQFGGRWSYSTGRPYTPVASAVFDSDRNIYYPINGELNSDRQRAAHQLDLRVDRIWKFKTWSLSAFLDINNAYMNAPFIQYQYNFDYTQRGEISGIPILPTIGIKGEL